MAGAYEALAAVTGITGNLARGRIKSVRGRAMQECLLLEELPSSLQRVVLQHVGRKALEELPMLQARLSGKSIDTHKASGAVWAPAPLFAAPAPETVAASRASPAPRRVRGRGPTMRRGSDGHARARAPQSTPAGVRARTATVGFAAWKHCEKFLSPARVRGCA